LAIMCDIVETNFTLWTVDNNVTNLNQMLNENDNLIRHDDIYER